MSKSISTIAVYYTPSPPPAGRVYCVRMYTCWTRGRSFSCVWGWNGLPLKDNESFRDRMSNDEIICGNWGHSAFVLVSPHKRNANLSHPHLHITISHRLLATRILIKCNVAVLMEGKLCCFEWRLVVADCSLDSLFTDVTPLGLFQDAQSFRRKQPWQLSRWYTAGTHQFSGRIFTNLMPIHLTASDARFQLNALSSSTDITFKLCI
jgi:hypothetical protein